jgi:hypothetical protein
MLDIAILGAFVTPAKQNNQFITALAEINAIAGAMIDPHFGESSACMFHIPKITIASPSDPVDDFGRSPAITQRFEPFGKLNRLPNLENVSFI